MTDPNLIRLAFQRQTAWLARSGRLLPVSKFYHGDTPHDEPVARIPSKFGNAPIAITTGRNYTGHNANSLSGAGFTSPFWGTRGGWQRLGASIRDDEKPRMIFHRIPQGRNSKDSQWFVFNFEQTTGLTEEEVNERVKQKSGQVAHAEAGKRK